jgi:excisionase family DNA binding protein
LGVGDSPGVFQIGFRFPHENGCRRRAPGWRPPVGISYGQPMEAKGSKKLGIATAPLTILTVREVSQYLRTHPTTIYRLLRSNQIPGFRVGSDWRFNTDAIDRWMSEQQASVKVPSHKKHSAPRT